MLKASWVLTAKAVHRTHRLRLIRVFGGLCHLVGFVMVGLKYYHSTMIDGQGFSLHSQGPKFCPIPN